VSLQKRNKVLLEQFLAQFVELDLLLFSQNFAEIASHGVQKVLDLHQVAKRQLQVPSSGRQSEDLFHLLLNKCKVRVGEILSKEDQVLVEIRIEVLVGKINEL